MAEASVQRPGSIRSVASNSSINSTVSLSRRPRTRTRSRTVTGASARPDVAKTPITSDLPSIAGPLPQEPSDEHTSSTQLTSAPPPTRPPRPTQRLDVVEIHISDTTSSQVSSQDPAAAAEATFVDPLQPSPNASKVSKATKLASNLPLLDTGYRPPPSAFSRDPSLTPVVNVRDSVSTQQSGTSSSLYPPSTSTASGPMSPTSPLTIDLMEQISDHPFIPEINEVQEYDNDDVAYRLRLLVKNNYFLPPAHSKPSPEDFAPTLTPPKKASRSVTPTFLDLFRVGKAKSKPTTPTNAAGFDHTLPMLRTTSDSIAAPYAFKTQQPRPSAQIPRLSPQMPSQTSRGRVVVVREKMNDVVVAAKQAELDLKARGVRIEQGSQKPKPEMFDDVIDPTDAVDIPLPSPSYPFAVQASALHGLGVLESVGADVLADRLPPSKNPNMSASYDASEDSWRKALLHEAVHHSLDNTPDASTFSHILETSTPLGSPGSKGTDTPSRMGTPNVTQQLIQQRIITQPIIDIIESTPSKLVRQKSNHSQASTSKGATKGNASTLSPLNTIQGSSRPSSYLPQRVDTPSGPMTPLAPPPRHHHINAAFSISQTDLANGNQSSEETSGASSGPPSALRRTVSSPSLAEGYESFSSRHESMMHPMPTTHLYLRDSQATTVSFETVRGSYDGVRNTMSESNDTDDEGAPRTSLASLAMGSQPSLSVYSRASMSPTTSVFQEMLHNEDHSGSSSYAHAGPSRFSLDQQNSIGTSSSFSRYSTMSPPPRLSSSLAHVALPPPPRSSSLHYQSARMEMPSTDSEPHIMPPELLESDESMMQIVAPEPTTPPLPIPERRRAPSRVPLSLEIPPVAVPVSIHSAPGPSSPTSFFDSIQAQPNAMDDLESSSDESEDEANNSHLRNQPKIFIDPRTRALSTVSAITPPRPTMMKLGNFSTPYLRGGSYRQNLLPIGNNASSKQPVSNVPPRSSDRPTDGLPSSSYDFYKYAQEHSTSSMTAASLHNGPRRPSTAENVAAWRNDQRAQESLRKLDGMLIQHMEDEKDTIKRIATTLKQTAQSKPSTIPLR